MYIYIAYTLQKKLIRLLNASLIQIDSFIELIN
jgi:hypothetical protein